MKDVCLYNAYQELAQSHLQHIQQLDQMKDVCVCNACQQLAQSSISCGNATEPHKNTWLTL